MLNPDEQRYLLAVYKANRKSLSSNVPIHGIVAKMRNKNKKFARYVLDELIKKGYVSKKPRGKNTTYYLTDKGLKYCREFFE
ncbi:MAG: hypothetical protein ACTSRU_12005 [Candidatus Hodarchaeales archaeon]